MYGPPRGVLNRWYSFASHKLLGFPFRNKMPQATFINMAGDLRHHRNSSPASDGDTGVRDVFQAANGFLKPSRAWRLGTLLYSERKLVIFFLMHFFVTLIVWAHFAFIKNREQEAAVPDGALNFYWKRIAPPLEFGSMHAILFQMALLPLTMSRLTIANLSTTVFDKFIPFNRMLRIHIHLGYTMVFIVVLATFFFFVFFGKLCGDGEQKFCDKFSDEITITGYFIFAMLIAIGVTSNLRYKINYRIFYVVHHVVFLMYILAIAHTMDVVQRTGKRERSQNFKWYSATLVFYVCDRMAMYFNNCYASKVVESATIFNNGNRMIKFVIERPPLFLFYPGQYAFLKIPELEQFSHPFSISSGPESNYLEFYIEVFEDNSWTGKLWNYIESKPDEGELEVFVQGPYGTPLARIDEFSHAVLIGSGTGVVPILSMFKQHARRLLRLDPSTYFRHLKESEEAIRRIRLAQESSNGTALNKATSSCRPEAKEKQEVRSVNQRTRESVQAEKIRVLVREQTKRNVMTDWHDIIDGFEHLQKKIAKSKRFVYREILLGLLPVLGMIVFSLALSWTFLGIELEKLGLQRYEFMDVTLGIITMIFQALFAVAVFCLWPSDTFYFFLDVAVIAGSVILDIFQYHGHWTTMESLLLASYLFFIGYSTLRSWAHAVDSKHSSWTNVGVQDGMNTLDSLHFVWVTRSASLAAAVLPDVESILQELIRVWGHEGLHKVCRVSIYVTDADAPNHESLQKLSKENGSHFSLEFNRPDFEKMMEDHMITLIDNLKQSRTVMAFCGSPKLASTLNTVKLETQAIVRSTGHHHHGLEFMAESYGGVKSPKQIDSDQKSQRRITKYHGSDVFSAFSTQFDFPDTEGTTGHGKRRSSTYL